MGALIGPWGNTYHMYGSDKHQANAICWVGQTEVKGATTFLAPLRSPCTTLDTNLLSGSNWVERGYSFSGPPPSPCTALDTNLLGGSNWFERGYSFSAPPPPPLAPPLTPICWAGQTELKGGTAFLPPLPLHHPWHQAVPFAVDLLQQRQENAAALKLKVERVGGMDEAHVTSLRNEIRVRLPWFQVWPFFFALLWTDILIIQTSAWHCQKWTPWLSYN